MSDDQENQLMVPEEVRGLKKYDDDTFEKLSGKGFLPRIQLMTDASNLVKTKKFPADHYGLFQSKDPEDIGAEIDVLIIEWRPKALDTSGENPITSFDPEEDLFGQIQHKADNVKDSGCMYGQEFLIWLLDKKCYATLFLGSKSARVEARQVKARQYKIATLTSQVIEGKKYTWTAMKCVDCVTHHEVPKDAEWKAEMIEMVKDFVNPPATEVEMAPEEDAGRER